MPTLLVVYQSMTDGTRQMVEAATGAARIEQTVNVKVLLASEAGEVDVLEASGYLFACPENLGSMAGLMKDFFDRVYYAALERIEGRPYALMICAGSDGSGAQRQIERIALGWRLRLIAEPVIVCTRAQTRTSILAPKVLSDGDLEPCRELGQTLAAGLALGIF